MANPCRAQRGSEEEIRSARLPKNPDRARPADGRRLAQGDCAVTTSDAGLRNKSAYAKNTGRVSVPISRVGRGEEPVASIARIIRILLAHGRPQVVMSVLTLFVITNIIWG